MLCTTYATVLTSLETVSRIAPLKVAATAVVVMMVLCAKIWMVECSDTG